MTVGPETCYRVQGGVPLQGTVFVQGAKNAALKMIAASLLASDGRTVLRNVPPIEDVRRAVELAQAVGAVVKFHEAERTLHVALVLVGMQVGEAVQPRDLLVDDGVVLHRARAERVGAVVQVVVAPSHAADVARQHGLGNGRHLGGARAQHRVR